MTNVLLFRDLSSIASSAVHVHCASTYLLNKAVNERKHAMRMNHAKWFELMLKSGRTGM